MGLSREKNLAPKLAALVAAAGGDREAAARAVVACPALLGYSLEGRLLPRLAAIERAGLPFSDVAKLVQRTDAVFESMVAARSQSRRELG